MAMVLSVVMDENLSTAERLSLGSSVEEGHLKEPMRCISLSLYCNILVISTASFLSFVSWDATFRDNDFEQHFVIVHGILCTQMNCFGYAAFLWLGFSPMSSMLGCFFSMPSMCLEYISGCKASDDPARENFTANSFVIGFADFDQRH